MGEEVTRNVGGPALPPVPSANPGRTGGTGSKGNTVTRNPATGNSPAGKPGSSTGGTGGKAQEKKEFPGLAPISDTVPTPATPKKKTRKQRQKKDVNTSFNAEQISVLFVTATSIIAARPGFEVFAISKAEADQLAAPIANMIAKSERLKNAGEYADAISLVTAALIIFAPRFVVYFQQQSAKKKVKEGPKLVRKETKNPDAGGGHDKQSSTPAQGHDSSILSAIPSLSF